MNKPKIDNVEFARIVEMTPEEAKSFMEGWGAHHSVQVVKLDNWLPIETAPKDGTPLLIFATSNNATVPCRMVGWYLQNLGWVELAFGPNHPIGVTPTHWMPLPPHPSSASIPA